MTQESLISAPKDGEKIKVLITGADKKVPGEAYLKCWTPSQRKLLAIKSLSIWWGLALLCIFIPLLHFILPPILIVLGVIASLHKFNRKMAIVGGFGTCPFCSRSFKIAERSYKWPLEDICTECNRHVKIIQD